MQVNGRTYQTIWLDEAGTAVQIIDQRHLPFHFVIEDLPDLAAMEVAIRDMHLRGAIVIGVAAAYGMYLAALEAQSSLNFDQHMQTAAQRLCATRPTAINLAWGVSEVLAAMAKGGTKAEKLALARKTAERIRADEIQRSEAIGQHGFALIKELSKKKASKVNILTHCNAGWLACVDYGTATAPIYRALEEGIDLHVWVDETRPRNQGARLTAWELSEAGIAHSVIVDNAGGHLMQEGQVDLVIVGADRVTAQGDVANKIGTYLKALAAYDNKVPFYVAFPSSTIDWSNSGKPVPIEERSADEVSCIEGLYNAAVIPVRLTPEHSACRNWAFDLTPARLITGLISERGVCPASNAGLLSLYPDADKSQPG